MHPKLFVLHLTAYSTFPNRPHHSKNTTPKKFCVCALRSIIEKRRNIDASPTFFFFALYLIAYLTFPNGPYHSKKNS